jgi:NAD(P)-dependent dehydrogenase (short-subunit alcohol dehydrogenase family)
MATPLLVTGAAGRVGGIGRTVTELLLEQGKAVRAMVRAEDGRSQALRDMCRFVAGEEGREEDAGEPTWQTGPRHGITDSHSIGWKRRRGTSLITGRPGDRFRCGE